MTRKIRDYSIVFHTFMLKRDTAVVEISLESRHEKTMRFSNRSDINRAVKGP